MNDLEGKRALVTGGTSGIGRATAEALAENGVHVVITGRSETRGAEVVAEIEAAGGTAAFVRADLASADEVRALAERTADVDILVNNAEEIAEAILFLASDRASYFNGAIADRHDVPAGRRVRGNERLLRARARVGAVKRAHLAHRRTVSRTAALVQRDRVWLHRQLRFCSTDAPPC